MNTLFYYRKLFALVLLLLMARDASASTTPAGEKSGGVNGVVLKLNGQPLRNAPVRLLEIDRGGFLNLFFPSTLDRPIASAITNSRGNFSLKAGAWDKTKIHKLSVEGLTKLVTKISGEVVTSGSVTLFINESSGYHVLRVPNDFVRPPPMHIQ